MRAVALLGKDGDAGRTRDALALRAHRLAEAIRAVVLGNWDEGVPAESEVLLMFAARAAHLNATIWPALARGEDVICDRFVDASYAYQGAGRGLGAERIAVLEKLVLGELTPDRVLVLDIAPELGVQRIAERGGNNRFDAESLAFMQRVRAAYLAFNEATQDCIAVRFKNHIDEVDNNDST